MNLATLKKNLSFFARKPVKKEGFSICISFIVLFVPCTEGNNGWSYASTPLPFSFSDMHRETCRLIKVLKSVYDRERKAVLQMYRTSEVFGY